MRPSPRHAPVLALALVLVLPTLAYAAPAPTVQPDAPPVAAPPVCPFDQDDAGTGMDAPDAEADAARIAFGTHAACAGGADRVDWYRVEMPRQRAATVRVVGEAWSAARIDVTDCAGEALYTTGILPTPAQTIAFLDSVDAAPRCFGVAFEGTLAEYALHVTLDEMGGPGCATGDGASDADSTPEAPVRITGDSAAGCHSSAGVDIDHYLIEVPTVGAVVATYRTAGCSASAYIKAPTGEVYDAAARYLASPCDGVTLEVVGVADSAGDFTLDVRGAAQSYTIDVRPAQTPCSPQDDAGTSGDAGDFLRARTPLPTIGTFAGCLDEGDTLDLYTFDAKRGDVIRVDAMVPHAPRSGDPRDGDAAGIQLRSPDRRTASWTSQPDAENATLRLVATEDGPIGIHVFSFGPVGPTAYAFTLTREVTGVPVARRVPGSIYGIADIIACEGAARAVGGEGYTVREDGLTPWRRDLDIEGDAFCDGDGRLHGTMRPFASGKPFFSLGFVDFGGSQRYVDNVASRGVTVGPGDVLAVREKDGAVALIDCATGARRSLATSANVIEFGPDGRLYATSGGRIDRIDTQTGERTNLAALDNVGTIQTLAFDGAGRAYVTDSVNTVWRVDLGTGASEVVGALPYGWLRGSGAVGDTWYGVDFLGIWRLGMGATAFSGWTLDCDPARADPAVAALEIDAPEAGSGTFVARVTFRNDGPLPMNETMRVYVHVRPEPCVAEEHRGRLVCREWEQHAAPIQPLKLEPGESMTMEYEVTSYGVVGSAAVRVSLRPFYDAPNARTDNDAMEARTSLLVPHAPVGA